MHVLNYTWTEKRKCQLVLLKEILNVFNIYSDLTARLPAGGQERSQRSSRGGLNEDREREIESKKSFRLRGFFFSRAYGYRLLSFPRACQSTL